MKLVARLVWIGTSFLLLSLPTSTLLVFAISIGCLLISISAYCFITSMTASPSRELLLKEEHSNVSKSESKPSRFLVKTLSCFGIVAIVVMTLYMYAIHFEEGAINFISPPPNNPLRRVVYTIDDSDPPEQRFNPRYIPEEVFYDCDNGTIILVGWFDDRNVEPLGTFARALERLSRCNVQVVGTLGKKNLNLTDLIKDGKYVIWWNWHQDDQLIYQTRKDLPNQVWLAHNWDDGHSLFIVDSMHTLKHLWQIVFSSASSALPTYMIAGAQEAHAFVPMVDDVHFYDPDPLYECDVGFVGTQPYSERGMPRNRTAILQALSDDAKKNGWVLNIYGTPKLGSPFPEHFKGPIRYQENRKVWSSCKISLNVHAIDGYGGWYANARTTEILGSRGLLVADRAVEGPLKDGEEVVILRSDEPDEIVKQVREILDNYQKYEPIRLRGQELAMKAFSARALGSKMLAAISRVTKSPPGKI